MSPRMPYPVSPQIALDVSLVTVYAAIQSIPESPMKKQHFLISASRDWRHGEDPEAGFILEAHEEGVAVTTAQALRAQGWIVEVRRWTDRQHRDGGTGRWRAGYVEMAA